MKKGLLIGILALFVIAAFFALRLVGRGDKTLPGNTANRSQIGATPASDNDTSARPNAPAPAAAGVPSAVATPLLAAAAQNQIPPATPAAAPAPEAASPQPSDPRLQLTVEDGGLPRTFAIALNEVVRRTAEGGEKAVPLPPQADLDALRKTWSALPRGAGEAFLLVAYEAGAERSPKTRRLVTPEIRLELAPGATLPANFPGSIRVVRPDYAPQIAVLHMTDSFTALDRLALLRALPEVRRADVLLSRQQARRALPNDPLINSQWHLKNTGQSGGAAGADVNVETVWSYPNTGLRGAGINVGVVDDGLETNHPDLAGNVRTDIDYDWNAEPDDGDPNPGADDDHGTACAGNVAAIGNNLLGVSGSAPEAKIIGLRLIAASTTDAQEADAMTYEKNVIDIKSNSWGPNDDGVTLEAPGTMTRAALKSAAETGRGGLGTIILWAGGNGLEASDNSNYDGYANSIYTIAVGAITNTRAQAYYSEPGANLAITAPSSGGTLDITTVDRTSALGYNTASGTAGNYTSDFGGTSSATPTAAGVVALLLQSKTPSNGRSTLGRRDVKEILMKSARQVNPTDSDWVTNSGGFHFNHKYGAGLIDAAAAVALASSWTNLAPETSAVATLSGSSVAIPNNNSAGITRTFDLGASNLRVEHVTLRLSISHTARGNLAITLTSPSGVVSRLSEVHSDTGNDFPNWTFSTVRNWGENSRGTWTLKIADLSNTGNTVGGTLTAAELTIFGTNATPANPAPVVQLTSPQTGSSYSIGAPIILSATASDLTVNGTTGSIARVDFLSGTTVLGSATIAPYNYTWTPPGAATYTLSAKAIDGEGAVGTSSSVTISVANLSPTIASASVTPSPQTFSDQPLSIAVSASDPEGAAVTLSYQWQTSGDGVNFTNAVGQTGATVAASARNAGKVWRCIVAASDGVNTSAPATSNTTMVLTRPNTSVVSGATYSYSSDLVLRGTATDFTRAAILNEFSQGPANASSEWVELLTLKAGSFRQWKFDDSATDSSLLTFANSAVWDNVPAGTRIVIYNSSAAKDTLLPPDDLNLADGTLVIASNNTTYFTGSWPSLANGNDGLVLRDAANVVVHQVGYGNSPPFAPGIGNVGSTMAAGFIGETEEAATTASGWDRYSSLTKGTATSVGVTPGEGNSASNLTFINNLRSGYYNQPALFRLGSNAQLPDGLVLNSKTGILSGTITGASGNYSITIERYNGLGETSSLTYNLTVSAAPPQTYSAWLSRYPNLTDSSPTSDPDRDGRSNFFEYFAAMDPTVAEVNSNDLPSAEISGVDLLLHYRKGKNVTRVTEVVAASTDLAGWTSSAITFDPDQDRGTYFLRTARQPINSKPNLFLRLTVEQIP